MMMKCALATGFLLIALSFGTISSYTEGSLTPNPADTLAVSRNALLSLKYPGFGRVSFAGEEVPIHRKQVFKRLERAVIMNFRELRYHDGLLKRHSHSIQLMEQILLEHQVPADFVYLPIVESRLTNKVSRKGAAGYWQLMPETARTLGLKVNATVDERNDLVKSTIAASKYLRMLYNDLGSWTLTAAAYNRGQEGLLRKIRDQGTNDYYELELGSETGSFLYRLISLKELLNNPRRFRQFLRS